MCVLDELCSSPRIVYIPSPYAVCHSCFTDGKMASGVKRKLEEDEGQSYLDQRQSVLNISMDKLRSSAPLQRHTEASLRRSVLIFNTLRQIENELRREGVKWSPTHTPSLLPSIQPTEQVTEDTLPGSDGVGAPAGHTPTPPPPPPHAPQSVYPSGTSVTVLPAPASSSSSEEQPMDLISGSAPAAHTEANNGAGDGNTSPPLPGLCGGGSDPATSCITLGSAEAKSPVARGTTPASVPSAFGSSSQQPQQQSLTDALCPDTKLILDSLLSVDNRVSLTSLGSMFDIDSSSSATSSSASSSSSPMTVCSMSGCVLPLSLSSPSLLSSATASLSLTASSSVSPLPPTVVSSGGSGAWPSELPQSTKFTSVSLSNQFCTAQTVSSFASSTFSCTSTVTFMDQDFLPDLDLSTLDFDLFTPLSPSSSQAVATVPSTTSQSFTSHTSSSHSSSPQSLKLTPLNAEDIVQSLPMAESFTGLNGGAATCNPKYDHFLGDDLDHIMQLLVGMI